MKLQDWRVLTRSECSLCEVMLQALCDLLGEAAAQVAVQDVSEFPELEQKYGQRLPVLLVDGELVCCYRLDEQRVLAYLPTP
jgi:hypothetical protein